MRIISLSKEDFDDYSKNHKYGSYMQTSTYGELETGRGFKVELLGFIDGEDLIGAGMFLIKEAIWSYTYAYAPRGLLMDYDDPEQVNKIISCLKKFFYKKNIVSLKIDPPILASEKDFTGKSFYVSNDINEILSTLKNNGFEHKGFNLYYETKLPRWNVMVGLDTNVNNIFEGFSEENKTKIRDALNLGVYVELNNHISAKTFYELVKPAYGQVGFNYVKAMIDKFTRDGLMDLFLVNLNTGTYLEAANKLYAEEEEINLSLGNMIESNDPRYNKEKVINDKLASDKRLNELKKNVISATNFMKNTPHEIRIGAAMVIKSNTGIESIMLFEDKKYAYLGGLPTLIYELAKYYGKEGYKYLSLGPGVGDFRQSCPQYQTMAMKKGLNSKVIEYAGEFDLVINPLMNKLYLKKQEKDKKKLQKLKEKK